MVIGAAQWRTAFASPDDSRSLNLYAPATNERCSVVYYQNGNYQQTGLLEIFYLLRDRRTGHIKPIDTYVLNALRNTLIELGRPDELIHIFSGYRTSKTNEMLASTTSGVAPKSYHLLGRAVDFNIPGSPTQEIKVAARRATEGGVGYYRKSNFIHLDSGPRRSWNG